ncbi:MAG TPA: hypothetical protein VK196_14880 [Magnetospirillum sp.]|nr:hypothetical protein [Magnetospirillum sp.]
MAQLLEAKNDIRSTGGFDFSGAVLKDSAANLYQASQDDNAFLIGASAVALTGDVSIGQLQAIAVVNPSITYGRVTGSAAELAADALTNDGAGTWVSGSHDVAITDYVTIAQLNAIDAATSGTMSFGRIADTYAHLYADGELNGGNGKWANRSRTHQLEITDAVAIHQIRNLEYRSAGTLIYDHLADMYGNLASDVLFWGPDAYTMRAPLITITNQPDLHHWYIIVEYCPLGYPRATIADTASRLVDDLVNNPTGCSWALSNNNVRVTNSATLDQLTVLNNAPGIATLLYDSITDSAANLAADAAAAGFVAGHAAIVNDSTDVAHLATIAAAASSVTWQAVIDTAAALAADAATNNGAGTFVTGAHNITVTDGATVAQLGAIKAALTTGVLTYDGVRDSAANILADIETNDGAGTFVTGTHDVTVTDNANVADLGAIQAALTSGTLSYGVVRDSAANILADMATNSGAGTYVAGDHDVAVVGEAAIADLIAIDQRTTGAVSAESVSGNAAQLVAAGSTYASPGTDVVVVNSGTLAQLRFLEGVYDNVGYQSVADTAGRLVADVRTHGGTGTYVIAGRDAYVTGAATISQLRVIDTVADAVVCGTVMDTAARLAADAATNAGAGTYASGDSVNVIVSGAATIAQLTAIQAAGPSLTYTDVADTAANLVSDVQTNSGAGTFVQAGLDVTVTGGASIAQLTTIDEQADTVTYGTVEDTAAHLAGNVGGYVAGSHAVAVTDAATLAQLATIDGFTTGTVAYGAVTDTAANLTTNAGGYVFGSHAVTVTDAASVAQLTTIDGRTAGAVSYGAVRDTAANLVAGTYVTGSHAVTVTDIASVAQLITLDGRTTGALTYGAVSDTAASLVASTYVTGSHAVTVTDAATIAQLATLDGRTTGALTYAAVTDTAANLVAGSARLAGRTITVNGAVTAAQATAIDAAAGIGTVTQQVVATTTMQTGIDRLVVTGSAAVNVTGTAAVNVITGNGAINVLSGLAGADTIDGGAGNDTLIGGVGADRLTGSDGADAFKFAIATEGADIITDFTAAEADKIQLVSANFGALPAGAVAATLFVANATGNATTTAQRFTFNTTNGQLYFDSNGCATGGKTLLATLDGVRSFAATSLQIVAS